MKTEDLAHKAMFLASDYLDILESMQPHESEYQDDDQFEAALREYKDTVAAGVIAYEYMRDMVFVSKEMQKAG